MTTTIQVTQAIKRKVIAYVRANGSITNRQCRVLLGIGYDQCITLFNQMIEAGELARVGKSAGVRYVLPTADDAGGG